MDHPLLEPSRLAINIANSTRFTSRALYDRLARVMLSAVVANLLLTWYFIYICLMGLDLDYFNPDAMLFAYLIFVPYLGPKLTLLSSRCVLSAFSQTVHCHFAV